MRAGRGALALAAMLATLLLTGACNPRLEAPTRTISGVLVLDQATPVERGGGECRGTGGYRDLRSGLETMATDENGNVLATGRLAAAPAATDAAGEIPAAERRRCVYTFTLQGLPDRPTYEVGVGERGTQTFTREELEAEDWTATLRLGV